MTKQNEPDREAVRDRPVFDVTPQMISAGVSALDFYRNSADDYEMVERVYSAMAVEQNQSEIVRGFPLHSEKIQEKWPS